MANEGQTNAAIASELGLSLPSVSMWRARVANQGAAGLCEAQRPGRPRVIIGDAQRLQLLALACEPAERYGRSTPTLDELCERATALGVVEQISRSHMRRLPQAAELRPHRVRQWLHSVDPQFREKVNAICALYRRTPKGSVVLSIDEKTGIQASERKHWGKPPGPERLRRQEFEYIRHGTQALTAAVDAHSGRVLAHCTDRRTQDDLVAFMERVARAYPLAGNRARDLGQPEHVPCLRCLEGLQRPARLSLRLSLHAAACQLGEPDRAAVCHLHAAHPPARQPSLHGASATAHGGVRRAAQPPAATIQVDVRRL